MGSQVSDDLSRFTITVPDGRAKTYGREKLYRLEAYLHRVDQDPGGWVICLEVHGAKETLLWGNSAATVSGEDGRHSHWIVSLIWEDENGPYHHIDDLLLYGLHLEGPDCEKFIDSWRELSGRMVRRNYAELEQGKRDEARAPRVQQVAGTALRRDIDG